MSDRRTTGISALHPIPLGNVVCEGGFWGPRLWINREQTLIAIFEQFQKRGHLKALSWFRSQKDQSEKPPPVHPYWDSDLGKAIEAAGYVQVHSSFPLLELLVDEVVDGFSSVQREDGYLNTYYTIVEPENRWKKLAFGHELYCAGHLIEAGTALYQTTGQTKLLDIVRRYADYIYSTFYTGTCSGYPGHPEIELALVKLYRVTNDTRYLDLSRLFLERRGSRPSYFEVEMRKLPSSDRNYYNRFFGRDDNFSTEYCQDHLPVREQNQAVGHAVRATYLYSAMVDVATETNDAGLLKACRMLWEDLTGRHMYITGGIGSRRDNEGIGEPYDLPNRQAYAETCAAIGLAFFSHRLLQVDPDSRYADILERIIYNAALKGVSIDGKKFTYDNPLESDGKHHFQEWFDVACCPPNLARFLASLGSYVYSVGEEDVFLHLFVQGKAEFELFGQKIIIIQDTDYPWDGTIMVTVKVNKPVEFGLNLRIPAWSPEPDISVNGESFSIKGNVNKGYLRVARIWKSGDTVKMVLPMQVRRIFAHPAVWDDTGCVALMRGPVVFCLEEVDQGMPTHQILLPRRSALECEYQPELLGGIPVIKASGQRIDPGDWIGGLYRERSYLTNSNNIKAIPYFTWNNRLTGGMQVWIHESPDS